MLLLSRQRKEQGLPVWRNWETVPAGSTAEEEVGAAVGSRAWEALPGAPGRSQHMPPARGGKVFDRKLLFPVGW